MFNVVCLLNDLIVTSAHLPNPVVEVAVSEGAIGPTAATFLHTGDEDIASSSSRTRVRGGGDILYEGSDSQLCTAHARSHQDRPREQVEEQDCQFLHILLECHTYLLRELHTVIMLCSTPRQGL